MTRRDGATAKMVVLAYHAIADHGADAIMRRYSVPPVRFARQLDSLAALGWTFVDVDAVMSAVAGERDVSTRSVLVTFDDGYTDFLETALPILKQRQIPSVVFVVSAQIGADNNWDREIGAEAMHLMDAGALRRIVAEGVEIGSHTMRHRSLAKLSATEFVTEIRESAAQLEALGLPRPRIFSYPYGHSTHDVEKEVRGAGYRAAFTVTPGAVNRGANAYALPRVMVLRGYTPGILRLRLATLGRRSERLERCFDIVGTRA